MPRRVLLLLGCVTLGLAGHAPNVHAVTINDATAAAAGGIQNYFDKTNSFPNVVELTLGASNNLLCTGTLINSRTILTAAHCFAGPIVASNTAGFSPDTNVANAINVNLTGATIAPGYNGALKGLGPNDIAMISLASPVTNITPVTLLKPGDPLPAVGTVVTLVGYGKNGNGTAGSINSGDGKRRIAMSELAFVGPMNAGPDPTNKSFDQANFQAQFRNPLSPNNPDTFGLSAMNIPTQALEGGVGSGDSGGPMFIVTPNGLVQIGTVIGGSNSLGADGGYGDVNSWTQIPVFSTWIAQNSALRQVSSNAGNFTWSNVAAWSDSVSGVAAQVPNNTTGVVTNALNIANYFNVTLANAGTITLDINPTIDSLAIGGAAAQLTIPQNTLLTTVVGSQVTAGTLLLNGGITTPTLSLTGGRLTGTGTVTGNVANAGGTVAPGAAAALGTLTVSGNYTQGAAGTLGIRLGPTASDQLAVGGAAALSGTLQLSGIGQPYAVGTKYNVLTANTLTGTFATTNGGALTAFLGATPTYSATGLQLTVTQTQSLTAAAMTPNELAVANALDKSTPTDTGTLATAATDLLNSTPSQAAQGLSELGADGSGDGDVVGNYLLADLAAARIVGNALDEHLAMLRADDGSAAAIAAAGLHGINYSFANRGGAQLASVSGEAVAAAGPAAGPGLAPAGAYNLWAHGIGGWQNLRSDGNAPGMTQTIGGVIAGIDTAPLGWAPGFRGGAAFSFTSGNLNGGSESGQTDAYRFALYGTQRMGPAFVEGRVGYGHDSISATRFIGFDGLGQTASGSTSGNEVAARLAAGYGFQLGGVSLEPSAAAAFDHVSRDGYSESGAGTLGLNVGSSSLDSLRLSLGARATTVIDLGNGFVARPTAQARFEEHVLNEMPTTTMSFVGAPEDPFLIEGVKPGRQSGLLDAGVTVGNGNGLAFFAAYSAELRTHETTQAVTAGLRVTW